MDQQDMYGLLLQHVARHIQLTAEEQQYFVSLLKPRRLQRRQWLLQAGDTCRYENFIVEGCLRSYITDRNDAEHVLHFAVEDWWITDLESLLTQTPSQVSIEALEPSLVLQLERDALQALYQQVPSFERFFRILHQNAYLAQNRRILQNISHTAAERYDAFLQQYPAIAARVPQKYLASYLGMTPVFLSQLRQQKAGRLK
ncbi:Crp/Fnr family transcriptional regulator [Chitinophaga oryzae]|uniref:Crp/Fnr family transcriptional regulator n=1 Tax=Chitinophaga oryzae TaxID=2725414 RepID=A0AAE7D9J8_9BACT|nr:Crp/Fnr family transcriptional regulator [Chitinophaga oryzae]QJB33318.1 Crp/Fnr family transcriptional regulator [Chitinophaga oryzae]QJB39838.1 Crp/Fnr family transcriptional regulator [Chitinophaga oryzae]